MWCALYYNTRTRNVVGWVRARESVWTETDCMGCGGHGIWMPIYFLFGFWTFLEQLFGLQPANSWGSHRTVAYTTNTFTHTVTHPYPTYNSYFMCTAPAHQRTPFVSALWWKRFIQFNSAGRNTKLSSMSNSKATWSVWFSWWAMSKNGAHAEA